MLSSANAKRHILQWRYIRGLVYPSFLPLWRSNAYTYMQAHSTKKHAQFLRMAPKFCPANAQFNASEGECAKSGHKPCELKACLVNTYHSLCKNKADNKVQGMLVCKQPWTRRHIMFQEERWIFKMPFWASLDESLMCAFMYCRLATSWRQTTQSQAELTWHSLRQTKTSL